MSIKHIFVSHAGEDAKAAEKLVEHLRNSGHETKVDLTDLSIGDDAIAFMNDGISDAHTVIILFSRHSAKAKWQQLEIHSAMWNQMEQSGGRCVVVRLDDTDVPAILGPKVYGFLNADDPLSLRKLIDELCEVLLPSRTASSLVAEALRSESKNPFRHLRAEFFENRPDLHAKAFAPPDATVVGALEEMKPCFLEGSRGTGKSMLLLSLRARNYLQLHDKERESVPVFGFYLKLSRGAICNAGVSGSTGEWDPLESVPADAAQISDIAEQELVIQIVESALSELSYCAENNLLQLDKVRERALCEAISQVLFDATATNYTCLNDVLDRLADSHKRVAEFIRRRFIYGESPEVPVATFDMVQLKRLLKLMKRDVPALKGATFVVLLDEYENLFHYQQRVVNGFVKLGPPDLSVKIAKKIASGDVSGTTTGQELQETHDYSRLVLVYDLENPTQRRAYYELLRHIVRNIVGMAVDELLPDFTDLEVDTALQKEKILELCKVDTKTFDSWPEAKQREKWTYYSEAATYRILLGPKGRHRDKRFAGFAQLGFVSSGVIRYFQEILGVAYHLTFAGEPPAVGGRLILPPENQTKAAHLVSQHNLTTLSRNVERYGEELKYFLLDLGDCLRHKLLRHASEPEAARLTITDPERLQDPEMSALQRLIRIGEREGVFQTKEGRPAFKPKHSSDPQPSEFNICRMYAPALEISPRLRWRTEVECSWLLSLVQPAQRAAAVQRLKKAIAKPKPRTEQLNLSQGGDS